MLCTVIITNKVKPTPMFSSRTQKVPESNKASKEKVSKTTYLKKQHV